MATTTTNTTNTTPQTILDHLGALDIAANIVRQAYRSGDEGRIQDAIQREGRAAQALRNVIITHFEG